MRLSRKVAFSSGHRYWLDRLSEEQNLRLFGRWASKYNHGHDYVLTVTAEGPIDPEHGMVVNIKRIDAHMRERVVRRFDQKSINDEVPEMREQAPCLENLLQLFWRLLDPLPGARLVGLELAETPVLRGELVMTNDGTTHLSLTRSYEFSASHRLHSEQLSPDENVALFGKCNNLHGHGHNYVLQVTVRGEPDPTTGMIVDLGELDQVVEELVVDRYDHRNLNEDIPEFKGANPTSEVVVLEIFERLKNQVPGRLVGVKLQETPRNFFEVRADD